MKPRTKTEKKIEDSAKKLSWLTDKQLREAIGKYAPHVAKVDSKGNCTCLDCGHKWKENPGKSVICPSCNSKLKTDKSRKRSFEERDYFTVVTTCNGFQVFRIFRMNTYMKKGETARHDIYEAFQRWFTPEGKGYVRSLTRNTLGSVYIDSWSRYSCLELRGKSYVHDQIYGNELGNRRYIKELIRNGFDGCYHKCNPYELVSSLLSDNSFETIWKLGYKELAANILFRGGSLGKYWAPLKIAIRHKYNIEDVGIWIDMVDTLLELGKDVHNPKFVCPENLMESHDKLMAERRRATDKRIAAEKRKKYLADLELAQQENDEYLSQMGKYFGLVFCDDDITVRPLVSVEEFLEEGTKMHHCVYTNKYYKKHDTLIMHALVEGASVATIELNLETMRILQCRGICNSVPKEKERIEGLINRNINKIVKINAA